MLFMCVLFSTIGGPITSTAALAQEVDYSGQGGAMAVSQAEAVLAPSIGMGRETPPGAQELAAIERQMGVHQQQTVRTSTF